MVSFERYFEEVCKIEKKWRCWLLKSPPGLVKGDQKSKKVKNLTAKEMSLFLGSSPKGNFQMSVLLSICSSVRLSICPSFHPSPLWPSGPQISTLRPDFGLLSPQMSPLRPELSPQDLKSALQTSNLPSKPRISPPSLKSALQASNLLFMPQIGPPGLK